MFSGRAFSPSVEHGLLRHGGFVGDATRSFVETASAEMHLSTQ